MSIRVPLPASLLAFVLNPFVLSALLSSLLVVDSARAASFACEKAQSRVEKAICADAEVSALDEYLGRYHAGAREALREGAGCLTDDQRQWLRTRDACADAACLKQVYLERLSVLDGLQPGATALRNVRLPSGPVLAWIIPAARDRVAAPPKPNAEPFSARGTLVDDVARGDGFVLRTAMGEAHILSMLMFLVPSTAQQLGMLAQPPSAPFLARGYAATDSSGRTYFEPSRCVFLYRLP